MRSIKITNQMMPVNAFFSYGAVFLDIIFHLHIIAVII